MKLIHSSILLYVCLSMLPTCGQANDKVAINSYPHQQSLFLKAEQLLNRNDIVGYKKLYKKLDNYPLQPYLKMRELINTLTVEARDDIIAFLDQHKNSPLDWPLRKAWLNYLVKKQRADLFLEAYNQTWNTKLHCEKLKFSLATAENKAKVFSQVNELWLVGQSLPNTCDPLLNEWQAAGYRTPDLIWQRLALAADGGQHSLIPYLTKLLPEDQQYLGTLWHKVRKNPAVVLSSKHFQRKNGKEKQIYSYGIKRLVWRAPDKAITSFEKAKIAFPLNKNEQQLIIEKFALALASKKHSKAREWLHKVDSENVESSIMQWQITDVIKDQDWPLVRQELASMPKHYKSEIQWKYWYARALIASGDVDSGNNIMTNVAKKRHYYGFLAATHLNTAVTMQNEPLMVDIVENNSVLAYPSAHRAFELYTLGRYAKARREWRYWLSQLTSREKLVAAKIANENGWVDRAIFTLAKQNYLDDVDLRFPKAFDKKITQYATKRNINPAWAFAITRRESSFMPDARSSAGAKGLMQIMPATAKELKGSRVDTWYLYNAENNIKLGTKYLRELLDKNKGNPVLATASYNAGPHRIKRWLKYGEMMPADIWIETIPFKETRNYVKSVLAYQEIYEHKPGQVSKIFTQLIDMQIGNQ